MPYSCFRCASGRAEARSVKADTDLKGPTRMLIFAAILAIFVYGMIAAMLGTILPDLSDRFHLTPTQNGRPDHCVGGCGSAA
jgi:Mg/Co/Ni transporter MgtE